MLNCKKRGKMPAGKNLAEKRRDYKDAVTAFWTMIVLLTMIHVIFSVLFCGSLVLGPSMEPTLRNGQIVVMQRMGYTPERGDIVSFYSGAFHRNFIKRVIGVEGDVIDIDFEKGIVYRNGEALDEDYVSSPTCKTMGTAFPLTVEEGCVFVLGDNRDNSRDSRWPGLAQIPCEDITAGKVLIKL